MNDEIIAIYCLCDDFIKTIGFQDWPNTKLTTAEIMTVAIVAARFSYGNVERTRVFMHEYRYIKRMLSKSRLNRRMHAHDWWNHLLAFGMQ